VSALPDRVDQTGVEQLTMKSYRESVAAQVGARRLPCENWKASSGEATMERAATIGAVARRDHSELPPNLQKDRNERQHAE
jgi:hypothetical protein